MELAVCYFYFLSLIDTNLFTSSNLNELENVHPKYRNNHKHSNWLFTMPNTLPQSRVVMTFREFRPLGVSEKIPIVVVHLGIMRQCDEPGSANFVVYLYAFPVVTFITPGICACYLI